MKKYPISLITLTLYLPFASAIASNSGSLITECDNDVSQTSKQFYQVTFKSEHEFLGYFLRDLSRRFSGHHEVFSRTSIIYSSKKEDYVPVKALYHDLVCSGIPSNKIWFDPKANLSGQGTPILDYIKETVNSAIVIFVGSPSLKLKYEQSIGKADEFLAQEVQGVIDKIKHSQGPKGIIPIWFKGTIESCFPEAIRALCSRDLSHDYNKNFFNLLKDMVSCIPHLKISVSYIEDQQKKFEDERNQYKLESSKSKLVNQNSNEISYPTHNLTTALSATETVNSQRLWKKVSSENEYPIHNLHGAITAEGFTEVCPEGASTSYLTLLWQMLNQQQSTTLTIKASVAGMGGIGKTSLAAQYAHEALLNQAYKVIYWISSETPAKIAEGYRDLLEDIEAPVELNTDLRHLVSLVRKHLLKRQPSLIVYDNVSNSVKFNKLISSVGHAIITSRCQEGWGKSLIDLDVFSSEDSIQYLSTQTGILRTAQNEKTLSELARELGYLPLALSHAASYISYISKHADSTYQFEDYLKHLKEQPAYHFQELQNPFSENSNSGLGISYDYLVARTLQMAKQHILDLSKQLMSYFAYLDPDQICTNALLDYAEDKFQANPHELTNSIAKLSAFSLIKAGTKISIHRLVQRVIRNAHEAQKTHPKFDELLMSFWMYSEPIRRDVAHLKDSTTRKKTRSQKFMKRI